MSQSVRPDRRPRVPTNAGWRPGPPLRTTTLCVGHLASRGRSSSWRLHCVMDYDMRHAGEGVVGPCIVRSGLTMPEFEDHAFAPDVGGGVTPALRGLRMNLGSLGSARQLRLHEPGFVYVWTLCKGLNL